MNLLAHALLAGRSPGRVVGAVLADWIKGPLSPELPADIADGVVHHHRVDVFTDAHPVTLRSRERLAGPWRRWAGVLVDLAYDFCLAQAWERFGPGPLEGFVREVEGVLADRAPVLPPPVPEVARRMIEGEWLLAGRSWEGITLALRRMEGRLRRPVPLSDAVPELRAREADWVADFAEFFPALRRDSGFQF